MMNDGNFLFLPSGDAGCISDVRGDYELITVINLENFGRNHTNLVNIEDLLKHLS